MMQKIDYETDPPYLALLRADLMDEFASRVDRTVTADYANRKQRNSFAAGLIKRIGATSIFNLGGGGRRHLGGELGAGHTVFEADMVGDCDLKIDLDVLDRLPFGDGHFDLACAFDVLEHLEKFHLVNDELYRISKRHVLISLPNAGHAIVSDLLPGRIQHKPNVNHGVYTKFYGLPLERPRDRHRWWFFFADIVRFYVWFAARNGCSLTFMVPRRSLFRRIVAGVIGQRLYYELFCPYLWILLRKPD